MLDVCRLETLGHSKHHTKGEPHVPMPPCQPRRDASAACLGLGLAQAGAWRVVDSCRRLRGPGAACGQAASRGVWAGWVLSAGLPLWLAAPGCHRQAETCRLQGCFGSVYPSPTMPARVSIIIQKSRPPGSLPLRPVPIPSQPSRSPPAAQPGPSQTDTKTPLRTPQQRRFPLSLSLFFPPWLPPPSSPSRGRG